MSLTVIEIDDGAWAVTDGQKILSHHDTNADAWRQVERLGNEFHNPAQKRADYGWKKRVHGK